jgi:unsaturated pyranuronate lyase
MSSETGYFAEATGVPQESGRFVTIETDLPGLDFLPGLVFRPLVGRNLMASFVRYEPNTLAPVHAHEEEQLFIVLEGEIELEIDGEKRRLRPGDAAHIPAFVPHSARSFDAPAYEVDVFSPPRRALLEMLEKHGS